MNLYTIIIPCHNDCEKAKTLKQKNLKLNGAIIVHNGCKKSEGFNWANKAKTINFLSKGITTPYTLVIDADAKLTEFCLFALEREMKKGIDFACANQVFVNKKGEQDENTSSAPPFSGGCWFIKTEILKKHPIPEEQLTEDTAYYEILKKKKIKCKKVFDAVCIFNYMEPKLVKKCKQSIRYNIGALQLYKYGVFQYPLAQLANVLVSILILYFFYSIHLILLLFFLLICDVLAYLALSNKKIEKKLNSVFIVEVFSLTFAPLFALWFFITQKRVW